MKSHPCFISFLIIVSIVLPLKTFSQTTPILEKSKPDFISNITLQEYHINPLLDLIAFYEVDDVILRESLGFQKWNFILINDPNNKADQNHLGAVKAPFKIGQYKVTAQQYTIFLNAVAAADPYHLFDPRMTTDTAVASIERQGSLDHYSYQVIPGRGDLPIAYVSWESAARFCNWLHNGFPTGPEGPKSTEEGAYSFHHNGLSSSVTPNPNALYFLPSEDQWYKAAYYVHDLYYYSDDAMMEYNSPLFVQKTDICYYLNYATSDTGQEPGNKKGCLGDANYANNASSVWAVYNLPGDINYSQEIFSDPLRLTSVGSFGPGHHQLHDMGGNLNEWTSSTISPLSSENYVLRGGSWKSNLQELSRNTTRISLSKKEGNNTTGFRVAAMATPLTPVAPAQTMEEAMMAHLHQQNKSNLDNFYTTLTLQPLLGPGEFLASFLLHETLETLAIFTADSLINECTSEVATEAEKTASSYLWRYWRVMAIPTAADLYAGLAIGGSAGRLNTAEVLAHAFIDSMAIKMIDYYGVEKAEEIAISWGMKPLIDFYKGLGEFAEYLLTPLKNRLTRYKESRGWTGDTVLECPLHDHSNMKNTLPPEAFDDNWKQYCGACAPLRA